MTLVMDFEAVVVGGGVLGLAISKKLSEKFDTILIVKNKSFGQETSSRNSNVIHAGIYYKEKSLKAQFCKKGNKDLYRYLKERGINYKKNGKLIISSNFDEDRDLRALKENAERNNLKLEYLNEKQTLEIEPEIKCYSSLLSVNTGVLDSHELMLNFVSDIEENGGFILYQNEVSFIESKGEYLEFKVKNKKRKYKTKYLINATGLSSYSLACKIKGLDKKLIPKIKLFKGNYFKLKGKSPFKKLIYPLPSKNSLGIHSTINLQNQTIFGPDEEQIRKINYKVDEKRLEFFRKRISKYWPNIYNKQLFPDYSGIRGICPSDDFIIQTKEVHKKNGLVNLFNINSPGLTSALAIADYIKINILNKNF